MKNLQHSIELRFNSTGYKGQELQEVLPDFITERDTTIGLTWYSSANGPESWNLVIKIAEGLLVTKLAEGFINELGKDLYSWVKTKLTSLLRKKNHPIGYIIFEFSDIQVVYELESLPNDHSENFAELFQQLPQILANIDPEKSAEWEIKFDPKSSQWSVTLPFKASDDNE